MTPARLPRRLASESFSEAIVTSRRRRRSGAAVSPYVSATATQRECLELLGCYGSGKVRKLAEIIAATILCGEISLGSAVVAGEWVAAHERLGRNRP